MTLSQSLSLSRTLESWKILDQHDRLQSTIQWRRLHPTVDWFSLIINFTSINIFYPQGNGSRLLPNILISSVEMLSKKEWHRSLNSNIKKIMLSIPTWHDVSFSYGNIYASYMSEARCKLLPYCCQESCMDVSMKSTREKLNAEKTYCIGDLPFCMYPGWSYSSPNTRSFRIHSDTYSRKHR